jgi:tRNA U34 5-methylaminomethyl-2-thiouridine-forming methyltransferase MnmC
LKREIIITSDGSTTIHLPDWNEQYHSKHGAIQEAYHVFIKHGLESVSQSEISILEIGFGTGLNAFITFLEASKTHRNIDYVGVEAHPVALEEVKQLNYVQELGAQSFSDQFDLMHSIPWEEKAEISNNFSLQKREQFFHDISDEDQYNLVYFDAFGARVQPDLWTEEIFTIMYKAMKAGGILVTYAAKGSVRRAMQAVGFEVERLPGPPGKREMLRATKP